ncbi:MAG: M48 family metalloprotease [Bacteroidales bacterium]|nr:M48 family metalloprotease [Bacteroidales bacterium]
MWEVIRKNQRKSLLLIMLMGVVLILLGYAIGMAIDPEGGFVGIILAMIIYFVMMIVAFSQGKSIMLRMSNAREVKKEEYPQLYNIVEEMRLAAGMPAMPKVYVIDDPSPNAFAAGMNPDKSVVAVTTGLLNIMNRDELQGVVAHEISHIINRDIRYMTLATVMVGTVAILSQLFVRSMMFGGMRGQRSSAGNKKGHPIMMIVALLFAILAPIAIQLLYFSVSRKREYLADASAARLTRYPEGLASALEKISGSTHDMRTADKSMAPMYIANPLKPKGQRLRNLSSTHPPLNERIRILRGMGKNSSYAGYQEAYRSVTGSAQGVIPASAMKQ